MQPPSPRPSTYQVRVWVQGSRRTDEERVLEVMEVARAHQIESPGSKFS
jgi:hypothetical protein